MWHSRAFHGSNRPEGQPQEEVGTALNSPGTAASRWVAGCLCASATWILEAAPLPHLYQEPVLYISFREREKKKKSAKAK